MQEPIDPIYEPYTRRFVDSCVTDFGFRFPWQDKLATQSWTKLIGAKKYKRIAPAACHVYAFFESSLIYVPKVQSIGDSLTVTWEEDDRQVIFIFRETETTSQYVDSGKVSKLSHLSPRVEDWKGLLHTYVMFLNGDCHLEYAEEVRASQGSEPRRDWSCEVN